MIGHIPAAKPVYLHLAALIQTIFLQHPTVFISNFIWKNISLIQTDLLQENNLFPLSASMAIQSKRTWESVQKRMSRLFPSTIHNEPTKSLKTIIGEILSSVSFDASSFQLQLTAENIFTLINFGLSFKNLDVSYSICWILSQKTDKWILRPFLYSFLNECLHKSSVSEVKNVWRFYRVLEDFGLFSFLSFLRYSLPTLNLESVSFQHFLN